MSILPYLLSAGLGALIGGGTNYCAIRMLFRPYRAIRLRGVRLPFTPGVIPARQEELAERVAEAVSGHLVTPEGLREALDSPDVAASVREGIHRNLLAIMRAPLEETVCAGGDVRWEEVLDAVAEHLEAAIVRTTRTEAFGAVVERLTGALTENIRQALMMWGFPAGFALGGPVGGIGAVGAGELVGRLRGRIAKAMNEVFASPETAAWLVRELRPALDDNLGGLRPAVYLPDPSVRRIADLLAERAMTFLREDAGEIVETIDIRGLVARRVREFPMAELERIVVACARKELRAITALGFLLGAVVGLLNPILAGWLGGAPGG
jgi:uncharacterized membrane-anchored protein YjiN (DUF445 family)